MNKTILVTGIGGVVGQGILGNIRAAFPEIRLVGTNTVYVSAGNHLCDVVYKIPMGDDVTFLSKINTIIANESVDLVIPSTDLESYHLAFNKSSLNADLAISSPKVTGLSLDKWDTYIQLSKWGIPFASSSLPSTYKRDFKEVVVKPRSGRGSRGININPDDLESFDDSYVIQELLKGPEITTTFYVTRQKQLHGFITFIRELDSGNTSKAEVTFQYDKELEAIIRKFMNHFECVGSINIQSKVTEKGIIPFEINSRISGTNSLRAHFGFNDVKYTIQEWIEGEELEMPNITNGSALRIIKDIIYPDTSLNEIKNNQDNFNLT